MMLKNVKIGTAPDSWGVWFPQDPKEIQWFRCMDEMALAGYAGVELGPWGYFPTTYEALAPELEKRKLELVATTHILNLLSDEETEARMGDLDAMASLQSHFSSAKYIVLIDNNNKVGNGGPMTEDQWGQLCKNAMRVNKHVKEKYPHLVVTYHCEGAALVGTEAEIERFLDETDLMLCLDTGHHVYGGGNAEEFYRKHSDRIPYIHVKDCDMTIKEGLDRLGWPIEKGVPYGIMCEPGQGTIDFKKLVQYMEEAGYEGYVVVEQDLYPCAFDKPFPIAKHTRKFLKEIGMG